MASRNGKKVAEEKARWTQKFKIDRSPQVKTDLDIEVDALATQNTDSRFAAYYENAAHFAAYSEAHHDW